MNRVLLIGLLALGVAAAGCGGGDGADLGGDQVGKHRGKIEVVVIDGTTKRSPSKKLEVWANGDGSFFPDLEYGTDNRRMAIEDDQLYIYPNGRKGRKIKVELEPPDIDSEVPEKGSEGLEGDSIVINIGDSSVSVMGASIPDIEEKFKR